MIQFLAPKFNAGGPFMFVILAVLAVATAVVVERLIFYFIICSVNGARLVARSAKAINDNKIDEARSLITGKKAPVNVLLATALERYADGMTVDEIQEGVEETAIKEVPRMAQRLNYLALFANIATLLGLLGTISGLQTSFGSLAAVEASKKATMLAAGISQAMNTTAFGLIVAVPCMVMYTILNNKQLSMTKDLDESVVRFVNFLKKKKNSH